MERMVQSVTRELQSQAEGRRQVHGEFGVLLVHGIGHPKRSETLMWGGEDFYLWLQRWLNRSYADFSPSDNKAELSHTYLTVQDPDDPDAPPHAKIWLPERLEQDDTDSTGKSQTKGAYDPGRQWILAESLWGPTFLQSAYDDLVSWGLSIGPLMLQRLSTLPLDRLFHDTADNGKMFRAVLWFAGVLAGAVILLGTEILFPVLVVALLVLQVIPPLSGPVNAARNGIAGWLGDAYLIATSPMRTAAMVQQVQHDLNWLHDRGCRRVAVVAHSGGAPVAYDALSDPRYATDLQANFDKIFFVTYGSGKRKVDIIRELLANRTISFAVMPLLRGIMVLCLVSGVFIAISSVGSTQLAGWVLILAAALLLIYLILQGWANSRSLDRMYKRSVDSRKSSERSRKATAGESSAPTNANTSASAPTPLAPFDDFLPPCVSWNDYCAIGDLVGEGTSDPGVQQRRNLNHSIMVHNINSLKDDHSLYWQNAEQFVPMVFEEMLATEGKGNLPPQEVELHAAAARRRVSRVRLYFGTGLLSMLAVAFLWITLWKDMDHIGSPLVGFFAQFIPSTHSGTTEPQTTQQLNPAVTTATGMLLVALVVTAWHKLFLFPLWRWWSRQETIAMFERFVPSTPRRKPGEGKMLGNSNWEQRLKDIRRGVYYYSGAVLLLPLFVLGIGVLRSLIDSSNFPLTSWSNLLDAVLFALGLALCFSVLRAEPGAVTSQDEVHRPVQSRAAEEAAS